MQKANLPSYHIVAPPPSNDLMIQFQRAVASLKFNLIPEKDNIQIFIHICEDILPNLSFAAQVEIPFFDNIVQVMTFQLQKKNLRLDSIIICNIVENLIRQVLKQSDTFKYKKYYLTRIFNVLIIGLNCELLEIQSIFAVQLIQLIELSDSDPSIGQLFSSFRRQLIYSFVNYDTEKTIVKITPEMDLLFDCSFSQDMESIDIMRRNGDFLEILDGVYGTVDFVRTLFDLIKSFNQSNRIIAEATKQICASISKSSNDELQDFSQMIADNRVEITQIILSQQKPTFNFTEDMFLCIRIIHSYSHEQDNDHFKDLLALILRIARIGEDNKSWSFQLNLFIDAFRPLLNNYLNVVEAIDLDLVFDLTYDAKAIVSNESACNMLQPFLTIQIYEQLADIIETGEDTQKYLNAIKNIKDSDYLKQNYFDGIMLTLKNIYDDDCKKWCQMLLLLIKNFGIEFFPIDQVLIILNSSHDKFESKISGQLILISVINDYLVKALNVSYLCPILEQSVDIIQQHFRDLQQEVCDCKVFTLILHMIIILHERSIDMVSFNYFSEQYIKENYLHLCQDILVPLSLALTHYNQQFWDAYKLQMAELNINNDCEQLQFTITDNSYLDEFFFISELNQNSYSQPYSNAVYNVTTQAFLLLSYVIEVAFGDMKSFKDNLQNYFQPLLYLSSCNAASFSNALQEKAVTIFAVLTLSSEIMEQFFKQLFLLKEQTSILKLTRFKLIQNLASKTTQISTILRLVNGIVDNPSKVAEAPISSIINDEQIDKMISFFERSSRLILPKSEKNAENAEVAKQYLLRLQKLRNNKQNDVGITQVINQYFNVIDPQLGDLLFIAPLQLLNEQTYFKQKLLNFVLQTTLEHSIKLEPEILINAVLNNINFFKNDSDYQNQIFSMKPQFLSTQTAVLYSEYYSVSNVGQLLKFPLSIFADDYVEFPTAVIEFSIQKLQKYLAVSQINGKMATIVMSLFELILYSVGQVDTVYKTLLKNSTNFTIKQLQDSGQYGDIVLCRLKIFRQMQRKEPFVEYYINNNNTDLYKFWRESLIILLDFDKYFQNYQSGDFLTKFMCFENVTDFFYQIEDDIQLDLTKICDVLQILILNVRPETQILLTSFLQTLDCYIAKQLGNNYVKYQPISSYLSFVQSDEQYLYFLSLILYVQLTYPNQFTYTSLFLDAEIANNQDKQLLYKIFNLISGLTLDYSNKIFAIPEMSGEQINECSKNQIFVKFDSSVARDFYTYFNFMLLTSTERYQKEFVGLVHRYNQSHIMADDINTLFQHCHQHKCILLLYLIVGYRIRDIDNSHRDNILQQFEELVVYSQTNEHQSTNFIILKFLTELLTNVSSIHDILIRKHTDSILKIILNVIQACMDQSQQSYFKYFSRRKVFLVRVYAGEVEIIPHLERNDVGVIDQREFYYDYDIRVRELLFQYVNGLAQNLQLQQDCSFVYALFCACVNQIDEYNDQDQQLPTLLALLDQAIVIGRAMVQRGKFGETRSKTVVFNFQHLIKKSISLLASKDTGCPLKRRLLWLIPLFVSNYEEAQLLLTDQFQITHQMVDFGFKDAKSADDVYQRSKTFAKEVILPLAFRVADYQMLNRLENLTICDHLLQPVISIASQIAQHEFSLAIFSAFYEAKLQAAETRNCRLMFLPFALLYQIIRKFQNCELPLWQFSDMFRCWAADPFCCGEAWHAELIKLDDDKQNTYSVEHWYALVVQASGKILV